MPRSKDNYDKTKKNFIVHHYQYNLIDPYIEDEIKKKKEELKTLIKKRQAALTIYLEKSHSILNVSDPLLKEGKIIEWTTNTLRDDGSIKIRRELVYIDKIRQSSDMTGAFDKTLSYITDLSADGYVKLECSFYGKESIIRLTGRDINDIENEKK